jgi:hypothetical protein
MLTFALVVALASGAAQTTPPAPKPPAPTAPAPTIPDSTFVKEKPKDAKPVKDAKAAAKVGDTVTITGRIGGRKEPFVKSRAMFFLVDPSLKACSENPGDTCTFPWDFCCETPETMKACMATIQIVGADGKPLKVSAEGAGGMKPLSRLTVVGTVREATKDGALVIDATRIHVE